LLACGHSELAIRRPSKGIEARRNNGQLHRAEHFATIQNSLRKPCIGLQTFPGRINNREKLVHLREKASLK
jgi:hypothetical protein